MGKHSFATVSKCDVTRRNERRELMWLQKNNATLYYFDDDRPVGRVGVAMAEFHVGVLYQLLFKC